jgi:hypothetical protein
MKERTLLVRAVGIVGVMVCLLLVAYPAFSGVFSSSDFLVALGLLGISLLMATEPDPANDRPWRRNARLGFMLVVLTAGTYDLVVH